MKDFKDASSHREPTWPLMGYAPGNYIGRCVVCNNDFLNLAKRAFHCLPCAIDEANKRAIEVAAELCATRQERDTLRASIQIVQNAK